MLSTSVGLVWTQRQGVRASGERRTLGGQQDVRSAAVAQAHDLLPADRVQFLWHDGAEAVAGAQAAAAVHAQHKHLATQHNTTQHNTSAGDGESNSTGCFQKLNTFKTLQHVFLSHRPW